MKKRVIALALVTTMILGATYVYAQGPGFRPGHRGGPHQESWCYGESSSLTAEQRSKFQELRRRFNEETAPLRGAMVTKRLELRSLWTNPKADSKAITDKEKELRDVQNQMRDKAVQYKLEARNILTPEQIEQFEKGRGMGPGFGRGHIRGQGHGMDFGHGMGFRSSKGPGYGSGPCY
ncbi:MAG: hypothetical protein A2169_08555 [Deltaproteobacteria bacterium RBG_13_47_9]|nr:MAG: hypothetical protein A2169_08555 [Deltaproteobacteria bacterium RBG_13_47_9]